MRLRSRQPKISRISERNKIYKPHYNDIINLTEFVEGNPWPERKSKFIRKNKGETSH